MFRNLSLDIHVFIFSFTLVFLEKNVNTYRSFHCFRSNQLQKIRASVIMSVCLIKWWYNVINQKSVWWVKLVQIFSSKLYQIHSIFGPPNLPPPPLLKGGGGKRTCTKGVQKFLLERGDKPEKGGLM